ncbi:hypothetical protein C8F04DRAFT_1332481 [Mycena alexandri]|uniref:Uncharacterized protein n=1 Tax=Mycena alexandri TaxID=1745969 RepID=A0AAD6S0G0_9AGAR|nr:hypothetical protein C8F04DRAFT_1332481 [Mycena alexandri]
MRGIEVDGKLEGQKYPVRTSQPLSPPSPPSFVPSTTLPCFSHTPSRSFPSPRRVLRSRPRGAVAADNTEFCKDFSVLLVPVPVPVPVPRPPPRAAAAVEHGRGAPFGAYIACSSRHTRRAFSGDFPSRHLPRTNYPPLIILLRLCSPRSTLVAALDVIRCLYVAVPSAHTVLRPIYAIHAATAHPTHRLCALRGVYLRAPTNGYVHLGLDARAAGGSVLGGCRRVPVSRGTSHSTLPFGFLLRNSTIIDLVSTGANLGSSVLTENPNNEIFHREARNSQPRSTQARKARESQVVSEESAELREKIAAELEGRRESNARTKEFNEQLKKLSGTSGSRKAKSTGVLTASSSGGVKAVAPRAGESLAAHICFHSDNVSAPRAGPSPRTFSARSDNVSAVPSSLNNEVNIESDKATTAEAAGIHAGYIHRVFCGTGRTGQYSLWALPPVSTNSPLTAIEEPLDTVSSSSTLPKKRRRDEADPADILEPDSVRSRKASARKRIAEGLGEDVDPKRAKGILPSLYSMSTDSILQRFNGNSLGSNSDNVMEKGRKHGYTVASVTWTSATHKDIPGILTGETLVTGLMPGFPIAFLIVKDIAIRMTHGASAASNSKQTEMASAASSGGILCFSYSNSSSSSSTSTSSSFQSYANGFVVKIPGPQILGYMIQLADPDQTTVMEKTLPANFFIPDDEYNKVVEDGGNGPDHGLNPGGPNKSVEPPAPTITQERLREVLDKMLNDRIGGIFNDAKRPEESTSA